MSLGAGFELQRTHLQSVFLLPTNGSGHALSVAAPMLYLSAAMIVMDAYALGTVGLK